MADDIKWTPTKSGDNEEDPKIVAQRFLNIFHQLHIFSDEKRELFNEMLLELSPQVKNAFRQLPGGSILLDYLNEIENGNSQEQDDFDFKIDTPTPAEPKKTEDDLPAKVDVHNFSFDTTEFARVLANTLAQANTQIIREFQRNIQSISNKNETPNTAQKVELVTDESFTRSIAEALSNAISTSEQKRIEDTKIIANSFLELQENINKMLEQNAQLKIVSDEKASEKDVSAFQFKEVVEDLVSAQTKFLKETSQSQKEELSSIVSSAIKDSVKLSTQSFAETLKQFSNMPTPITYASPEQKKQNISEIENVIKTQGREFYSIIAAALKESQKNSTQSIIKTIESLTTSTSNIQPQKTEEIVKAQTQLFREITKEQNREFSETIAKALKEGQKQSADAIMELIKHLPQVTRVEAVQVVPQQPVVVSVPTPPTQDVPVNKINEPVNEINKPVNEINEPVEESKKKKKKKKKNKESQSNTTEKPATNFSIYNVFKNEPISPVALDKPSDPVNSAESWGFVNDDEDNPPIHSAVKKGNSISEDIFPEDLTDETLSIQKNIIQENSAEDEISGEEGKDWEWDYKEVADDNSQEGEEGKDWEWDYEEVADDNSHEGEEGKDWEWDYEEVADDSSHEEEGKDWEWDYEEIENNTAENLDKKVAESSAIAIPDDFKLLLVTPNIDNFEDPYIETIDDIY